MAKSIYLLMAPSPQSSANRGKQKKRGSIGPHWCCLCQMHEETTNHLLDECNFSSTIWKEGERIFRKNAKQNGRPDITISQWQHQPFSSKILNQIWELFLGFVVCEVWIESNNRVFKDKYKNKKEVWDTLKTHIQETLKLTC